MTTCLDAALKSGYRSIGMCLQHMNKENILCRNVLLTLPWLTEGPPDTASIYKNEEDIGLVLEELMPRYNLMRSDLFLTSKLCNFVKWD